MCTPDSLFFAVVPIKSLAIIPFTAFRQKDVQCQTLICSAHDCLTSRYKTPSA